MCICCLLVVFYSVMYTLGQIPNEWETLMCILYTTLTQYSHKRGFRDGWGITRCEKMIYGFFLFQIFGIYTEHSQPGRTRCCPGSEWRNTL